MSTSNEDSLIDNDDRKSSKSIIKTNLIKNFGRIFGKKRNQYENLDINIQKNSNQNESENILLRNLTDNVNKSEHLPKLTITSKRFLSKLWTTNSINDNSKWRRKENLCLMLYVSFYTGYLVLGSIAFQIFESPLEMAIKKSIQITKNNFVQKYQVSDNDLEEFLTAVIRANDRGISPLRNVSNELNWGFGQALFFSTTVITTIGYGHVTPLSQTGKIFCMLYATIGIPLTLVLLTAVVERLLIPANWLLGSLNAKLGHLYQPFNIRLLHLSIIVVMVSIIFFAIPTTIFDYLESDWDTLDAFYYCFISLTTVGLGDYIPGDGVDPDNRSLYKIFITIYLICGLMAMMLALTIFYDIPQLNLGQLFTENSTGETEKLRLSGNNAPCYSGPSGLYITQRDEDMRRIRVRPHGDDSPSPDEQPDVSPSIVGTSIGGTSTKDIRVP